MLALLTLTIFSVQKMIPSHLALFSVFLVFMKSVLTTHEVVVEKFRYDESSALVKLVPLVKDFFRPIELLNLRLSYYIKNADSFAEEFNKGKKVPKLEMTEKYPTSWGKWIVKSKINDMANVYAAGKKAYELLNEIEAKSNPDAIKKIKSIVDWSVYRCGTDNDGYKSFKRHFLNLIALNSSIFEYRSSILCQWAFDEIEKVYLSKLKKGQEWHSDGIKDALDSLFVNVQYAEKLRECKLKDGVDPKAFKKGKKKAAKAKNINQDFDSSTKSMSSATAASLSTSSTSLEKHTGSSLLSTNIVDTTGSSSSATVSSTIQPEKEIKANLIEDKNKGNGEKRKDTEDKTIKEQIVPNRATETSKKSSFWTPLSITLISLAVIALLGLFIYALLKFCFPRNTDFNAESQRV